jgi:hypothetical protein
MSEEREQRNQVFTAPPQGVDPRIPQATMAERAKSEFGIDVPVETVPLPSAGLIYPPTSPLHKQDHVDIRPGTAREEDILTSAALLKKGTIITELLKSCLTNKAVDPLDMIIGDRAALLVAIRVTMYGAEYDVELKCNEEDCGTTAPRTFDLSQFPIRRLEIAPVQEGMNLFEFVLPFTKKVVRFKFLTGRDEEMITHTEKQQKKLGLSSDKSVTTSLLHAIQSIDGNEKRDQIANFVRMMPARDSLALRTFIRDNEPGIIMKQDVSCPSCGHTESVSAPMGVSFFWPGTR